MIATRKPVLIGIYSPRQQSGKSTTAHLILDELARTHRDAVIRSFAAPLKLAACAFLESVGLTDVEATRVIFERKDHIIPFFGQQGIKGRDVLGWIGQDIGRNKLGEEVWVNRMDLTAQADLRKKRSVIVDDVRMENEADWVKRNSGFMVRLDRESASTAPGRDTEGRLEGFEFDATLANNGSLRDLERLVRVFVRGLPN